MMSEVWEKIVVVTKCAVPRRHQWQASALPVLFGAEPEASDPWPGLLDAVEQVGALASETREAAMQDAARVGALSSEPLPGQDSPRASVSGDTLDPHAPMRVVLMGRTMAGKSSLLTAMTGSHVDRIGDGRQRFSRDIFGAAALVSEQIEVVDTPGVGAHGGTDDTEVALRAARDADVIVWVNSSDSIQEESAAALKLLGGIGKPIIVAVNCRQSLEGVGRLNLLRFPDRVFGNKEGLLNEIRRHMADAGVEPIEVVYIHALAAAHAQARTEIDSELHAASRIEHLTNALMKENSAHSEARRALRLVDSERTLAEELALSLRQGAANLRAQAARDRAMTNDVHARLSRLVRATGEAMISDIESAVGRRRDWHLTVIDFGKVIQAGWDDEIASLHREIADSLEVRSSTLTAEVRSTVDDAVSEWTTVSLDEFALRDLAGFDAVWGNRVVRAGVGIGSALAVLGAGALVGGPVGLAIAAVGGPVAGVAATRLKNLTDSVLLGKEGVLRRRREEVASQVGPILDELTQEYEKAINGRLDKVRDDLARDRERSEGHSVSLDRLSSQWMRHSDVLRSSVRELDRVTTSALLRINRRERLARSVTRATRRPGVCILAEFEDPGFWESWLFPPDLGETLAGGKAPFLGGEAASALSYALGLVDVPVRLAEADAATAHLAVDSDVPPSITVAWSDALAVHTNKHIKIETRRISTP